MAIAVAVIGWLLPASVAAQEQAEPVPCEVAMVVGCVATIAGTDGEASLTLQVSDLGGQEATIGSGVSGRAAATGADGDETGNDEQDNDETGSSDETGGEQAEQSDRPLQSTVDPWERGGLKSNFGTDSIPISHYQIGADTTGWLGVPDPLDSFVASQTNWAFTSSTFLVLLATNALDWAFEFPLAEDLVGDAGLLAQSYTVDFFGFGLATSVYGLALSVTMVVAGFKAVTRGMIAAGSEVLVAFVAYVVLIVLTMTAGFGNAGLTVSRLSSELAGGIASFASGEDRQAECARELRADRETVPLAGAEAVADGSQGAGDVSSACSFGFALQRSLVELPYQNLQWGQVLDGVDGKERCAAINRELLAEGPWGNADEPRERMGAAAECEENADFNHQATYIRLGIASANTVTAAAVTLLILIVSAMLLWQQIKLLFLTVTMPHALVFAILPGRSRAVAWQWVEHLVGVVIRTVILSLGLVVWLSLFSLIVYEQLTLRGIFLSLFASIAMAMSGFWGLYRMNGMTRRINPASRRGVGRGAASSAEDGGPADPPGGGTSRRVATGAARSTMRMVSRRRSPTSVGDGGPLSTATATATGSRSGRRPGGGSTSGRPEHSVTGKSTSSTISGGPGDPSGGGAAAPSAQSGDRAVPIGAGRS